MAVIAVFSSLLLLARVITSRVCHYERRKRNKIDGLGDLSRSRTCGRWAIGQPADQAIDSCGAVFHGCALVVRERNLSQHPLKIVFCFQQLSLARVFGYIKVAARARHAMRALFEEAVS